MLTPQEQWKVACLHVCAEHGLTMEETHAVIKEAIWLLETGTFEKEAVGGLLAGGLAGAGKLIGKGVGGVLSFGGDALLGLLKTFGTAALLAPIALGGVTGAVLGKGFGGTSEEDVEEAKKKELIDAYQSAAERARTKSRIAKRKAARPVITRSLV